MLFVSKHKCTPFGEYDGSLLRRQPQALQLLHFALQMLEMFPNAIASLHIEFEQGCYQGKCM